MEAGLPTGRSSRLIQVKRPLGKIPSPICPSDLPAEHLPEEEEKEKGNNAELTCEKMDSALPGTADAADAADILLDLGVGDGDVGDK